ncbi:hypothetical protein [Streptomyces sp. NPDC058622]|uniref:hypothetical protein n=1 Tax=Streptomyces sp. NPDC058622 TaxID=3346562 RepID=UPI00365171EC
MPTTTAVPLLPVDGHHPLHRARFGFPKRDRAPDSTDVTGARRDEPATAPGRPGRLLARIRESWDEVVRPRSLLRPNSALPYPQDVLTGAATPELDSPAPLMRTVGPR